MSLFSSKQTVELDVQGMHCEKCAARVREALESVDGVSSATVDLDAARAVVEGRSIDTGALIAAVEDAGFSAATAGD